MDIAEFLLARIAEDEAAARIVDQGEVWLMTTRELAWTPARVLAECEAKRRILRRLADLGAHLADTGRQMPDMHSAMLVDGIGADLALPYADHPDYDPAWSVLASA